MARQANRERRASAESPGPPDTVLPSQFFLNMGSRQLTSEQRLVLAILADAINILQSDRPCQNLRKSELFDETARWVADRGAEAVFSFDNVCESLGIHPEALRGRLAGLSANGRRGQPVRFRLKDAGRPQHLSVVSARRRRHRRDRGRGSPRPRSRPRASRGGRR